MNYMSDKKRKKSPEPARKRINLGTPINIAAGPLRFRPELDTDPEGNRTPSHRNSDQPNPIVATDDGNPGPSRIVSYGEKNKDQGHSAPETSTRGIVVGAIEHGGNRTGGCF